MSPSSVHNVREWVVLIMAVAAGGVFLHLCIKPDSNPWFTVLSLVLCLTLLGKMTLLDRILKALNDR